MDLTSDRPGDHRVSAQPGEGTDVPDDIDIHTTAGKLADLERRLDEAVHAGSAKAVAGPASAAPATTRHVKAALTA